MWPVIDLVELTLTSSRASPNTALIAFVSFESLSRRRRAVRVDVVDVGRRRARRPSSAPRMARCSAFAFGRWRGEVVRVARRAVADDLGVDRARRASSACSSSSRMTMPAPSPITKPSRVASNGRDAVSGTVVALGERLHVGEAADRHRRDGRFGAAGDHDVGVAVLDRAERVADRVRARRAGRDGGVVRALAR